MFRVVKVKVKVDKILRGTAVDPHTHHHHHQKLVFCHYCWVLLITHVFGRPSLFCCCCCFKQTCWPKGRRRRKNIKHLFSFTILFLFTKGAVMWEGGHCGGYTSSHPDWGVSGKSYCATWQMFFFFSSATKNWWSVQYTPQQHNVKGLLFFRLHGHVS